MTTRSDLALFWGAAALGVLLLCSCLPVDLLRADALARERIDADIGARASCAAAELSGLAMDDPAQELALAPVCGHLREIQALAETGVHRAQTAQLLWSADPQKAVAIGSPADDRHVVTMAGRALEANRKRWWHRAPERLMGAVLDFAGSLSRVVVVRVADALPWWVWALIALAVKIAVVTGVWGAYVRFIKVPRLRARHAAAEAEAAERIAHQARALDEIDDGVELLPPRIRQWIGKGKPALAAEHKIRNDRRKAAEAALLSQILGAEGQDVGMRAIQADNARLTAEKDEAVERARALGEIVAILEASDKETTDCGMGEIKKAAEGDQNGGCFRGEAQGAGG